MSSRLDFKLWLAERRRQAGMTQRDLAKKSGLSSGYLALLETGTSEPPPLNTCKRLAVALGLNWNETRQVFLAIRLKNWLRREGYADVIESEILDIAARIELASGQHPR